MRSGDSRIRPSAEASSTHGCIRVAWVDRVVAHPEARSRTRTPVACLGTTVLLQPLPSRLSPETLDPGWAGGESGQPAGAWRQPLTQGGTGGYTRAPSRSLATGSVAQ